MNEDQNDEFKRGIRDIADSVNAYCERGRFMYEANIAICKAKGVLVPEEVNEWGKLTQDQKDFWTAMADTAERDLHAGKSH